MFLQPWCETLHLCLRSEVYESRVNGSCLFLSPRTCKIAHVASLWRISLNRCTPGNKPHQLKKTALESRFSGKDDEIIVILFRIPVEPVPKSHRQIWCLARSTYFDLLSFISDVCNFNQPVAKLNFSCFYIWFILPFFFLNKFLEFKRNEIVD